jgi:hypothetical protein
MRNTSRRRVSIALRTVIAGICVIAGSVAVPDVAVAGPSGSSCSTSEKGCVRMACCIDTYQFNSDDADLTNNYYHSEACWLGDPACVYSVANDFGKYKKNQTSYTRFCRYANGSYSVTQGWVTQVNVWATTASPHQSGSLRFRTSDSC